MTQERAAHVAVGQRAGHTAAGVHGKQRHGAAAQSVQLCERIKQRCFGGYDITFHMHYLYNASPASRVDMIASATTQSRGVSRSMLRSAGITDGTRRRKAPMGMARSEAGLIT